MTSINMSEIASDDLNTNLNHIMKELQKPFGLKTSAIEKIIQQAMQDIAQGIQMIHKQTKDISDKMGSTEDVQDEEQYQCRLQAEKKRKNDQVEEQTYNLQLISEVTAERKKLEADLSNLRRQTETNLKGQQQRLDKERALFTAYLKLSGDMRLDSQHTGPEVRGTVSSTPTADITFSLDPRVLSDVQLTDRLWRIATEAAEEKQRQQDARAEPPPADGRSDDHEKPEEAAAGADLVLPAAGGGSHSPETSGQPAAGADQAARQPLTLRTDPKHAAGELHDGKENMPCNQVSA